MRDFVFHAFVSIPAVFAPFDISVTHGGDKMIDLSTLDRVRALMIEREGVRLKPYHDSVGKITIGIGRNLQDIGITEIEALYLMDNDIKRVVLEAGKNFKWFGGLNGPRQVVVISMIFNMGLYNFSQFKNTISALEKKDYLRASDEMLDSDWAQQVGRRAYELSQLMLTGQF